MKPLQENLIIIAAILVLPAILTLPGCAQMFTSKTNVSVEVVEKDKTCRASYTSDKEQEGLEATVCGGKIKAAKSGTLESVIEGVTALQRELAGILSKLADGAKAAGS